MLFGVDLPALAHHEPCSQLLNYGHFLRTVTIWMANKIKVDARISFFYGYSSGDLATSFKWRDNQTRYVQHSARAGARFNFSINCQYEIVHICGIVSISMAK